MDNAAIDEEKKILEIELKKRLLGDKRQVTYRELLDKDLPDFLKSYLQNYVKRIYSREKPIRILENARYNLKANSNVKKAFAELEGAVIEATIFTQKEIEEAIKKTIGLKIDLFVKPRQTLINIFYKTKQERQLSEITKAVSNIEDRYPYINHLIQLLKKNPNKIIDKSLFSKITEEAEKEVYQSNDTDAIIQEISLMLNYMGKLLQTPCKEIKRELVYTMLQQRKLNQFAQRFMNEEIKTNSNSDKLISIAVLEKRLKKYLFEDEGDSVKNSYFAIPAGESFNAEIPGFEPENSVNTTKKSSRPVVEAKINEIPEQQPVHTESFPVSVSAKDDIAVVEKPAGKKARSQTEIFLKSRVRSVNKSYDDPENIIINRADIESQPEGPIPPLKSLVNQKNRKVLIKKIFHKSEDAYNRFIEKLELTDTWKEAKHLIDDELNARGVEPFSREAILLGDIVFNRYFPKKNL